MKQKEGEVVKPKGKSKKHLKNTLDCASYATAF